MMGTRTLMTVGNEKRRKETNAICVGCGFHDETENRAGAERKDSRKGEYTSGRRDPVDLSVDCEHQQS